MGASASGAGSGSEPRSGADGPSELASEQRRRGRARRPPSSSPASSSTRAGTDRDGGSGEGERARLDDREHQPGGRGAWTATGRRGPARGPRRRAGRALPSASDLPDPVARAAQRLGQLPLVVGEEGAALLDEPGEQPALEEAQLGDGGVAGRRDHPGRGIVGRGEPGAGGGDGEERGPLRGALQERHGLGVQPRHPGGRGRGR